VGRTRAIFVAFLALCLCSVPAFAGDAPEYHLNQDPAARLFRLSPFAHGYMHGYEDGFSLGDNDLQLGRVDESRIEGSEQYRDAEGGYQRGFGDRENFRAGYREGLVVGYHDACSGGEFRATSELRRLATGLENALVANRTDSYYDGGFLAGYHAARQNAGDDCQNRNLTNESVKEHFCSGFTDGYELGESDSGAVATAAEYRTPPRLPAAPPKSGGHRAKR
jgi:hypothetical protein